MSAKDYVFSKLEFWEEAENDLKKLDGHQKKFVYKALSRIQESPHDIGEALSNKRNIRTCLKTPFYCVNLKMEAI